MYTEAKRLGISFTDLLAREEKKQGYAPAGDAAKLDAFERQLVMNEINSKASLVEEFFKTSESAVLFPEYISRQIELGMEIGKREVKMSDIVAATEMISKSGAARIPAIDLANSKRKSAKVAEGAEFPKVQIKFKDKTVVLEKIGKQFEFSYEAIRRMSLPVVNLLLQHIGHELALQKTEQALLVMRDGDGNPGSAADQPAGIATWTYARYVELALGASRGHEFTHLCMNNLMLQTILTDDVNFKQFQSVNILERFLTTGEITDFLGVKWTIHPDVDNDAILAWEQRTGLVEYKEAGSQIVESDKIIEKQLEKTVISETVAFGKPFSNTARWQIK